MLEPAYHTLPQWIIDKVNEVRIWFANQGIKHWQVAGVTNMTPPEGTHDYGVVVFRDISTAPRDGSTILLRCPKGILEGAWEQVDGGGHPENGSPIYWWTSPFTEFIDGPWDAPTHWALIPRDAETKPGSDA